MPLVVDLKNGLLRSAHNFLSTRTESKYHFLFITTNNLICQSQIFPFYYFKKELFRKIGITFSEVDIDKYTSGDWRSKRQPDLIFYQPWFNRSKEELQQTLAKIKKENPSSQIVFLDSYAPLDLRFAETVDPIIDVYVKKHVFRDRSRYGQPTLGDTNLVDYYGNLYKLDYPQTTFNIPAGFLDKLVVGTGFESSKRILPFIQQPTQPAATNRTIDIHARLGGFGVDWYGRMREQALHNINDLGGVNILVGADVQYHQYIEEMRKSKMCFSPFGFGEVCWRDFESMMCGALLIKPDMQHVETRSNIFREYETYIPVKWDFSDLQEKVHIYLADEAKRTQITRNAYAALQNSITPDCFLTLINAILITARLH